METHSIYKMKKHWKALLSFLENAEKGLISNNKKNDYEQH
jgi:hypothetical protein